MGTKFPYIRLVFTDDLLSLIDSARGSVSRSEFLTNIILDYFYGDLNL